MLRLEKMRILSNLASWANEDTRQWYVWSKWRYRAMLCLEQIRIPGKQMKIPGNLVINDYTRQWCIWSKWRYDAILRLEQMKIQGNVTCTSGVKEGIRQMIIPGNDTSGVYEDTMQCCVWSKWRYQTMLRLEQMKIPGNVTSGVPYLSHYTSHHPNLPVQ